MRNSFALLIVSTLAASVAACGTPTAVDSGTGTTTSSTETQTGTTSDPVTPSDPTASTGSTGGTSTQAPSTPAAGLCGTSATAITYSGQAQAVIAANCTVCHNATSPKMTDYDSSKTGFAGGGTTAVENGVMPISITLSPNDKCILQEWAKNNYAK